MKGLDRINQLIQEGFDNDQILEKIVEEASQFKVLTKKDITEIADTIMQIKTMNVFAKDWRKK